MMYHHINNNNKREIILDDDEHDIDSETSQLVIRSPSDIHNKRPRYEPSWTLDNLCTHPCSPLASIDLESIFNINTFQLLPQEKRNELCSLLPDIDQNSLLNHEINNYPINYNDNTTPTFFSKSENPIFWNHLSEWQTMLTHGDFLTQPDTPPLPLSPSLPNHWSHHHKSKLSKSKPIHKKHKYKDEMSEPNHSHWDPSIDKEKAHNVAGDSKSITLKDMCRKGLIREHDVIVYKRNFSACKVVVSKSMTVVKACGLSGISIKLDDEIFNDFETPTALETKILDYHGKVTKDKRPNGNAFKSIRLIRAGKDMGRLFDIRKDGFGSESHL